MLMKESLDKTSNALKLTRLDVYVFAHSLNNCNAWYYEHDHDHDHDSIMVMNQWESLNNFQMSV